MCSCACPRGRDRNRQGEFCVTCVAGTRERENERQLFGETHEDRQGSQLFFFRFCAHAISSCSVPCADAGQEVTLGISERNQTRTKSSRLSCCRISFFAAGGDTADPTTAALGYLTCIPRHRHEADRACDRYESTFTLSIAVDLWSPSEGDSKAPELRLRDPVCR
jgi:hypothetical protein